MDDVPALLADYATKEWVLSFGYTTLPEVQEWVLSLGYATISDITLAIDALRTEVTNLVEHNHEIAMAAIQNVRTEVIAMFDNYYKKPEVDALIAGLKASLSES